MTEAEQEARTERRAICLCEKVPQEQIDVMFKKYVDIFGIADYTEKQGELI